MLYLPQEILPLLEQYKKLVLWFGADAVSLGSVRAFSKKLGEERCYFIRCFFKCIFFFTFGFTCLNCEMNRKNYVYFRVASELTVNITTLIQLSKKALIWIPLLNLLARYTIKELQHLRHLGKLYYLNCRTNRK